MSLDITDLSRDFISFPDPPEKHAHGWKSLSGLIVTQLACADY